METCKQYLVLEFKDAGMIVEPRKDWKSNPSVKKICEIDGVTGYDIFCGHDISNPIPYTTLSNMLAKLMGFATVPTKPMQRERMAYKLERPSVCDEMAKTGYINFGGSNIVPENAVLKRYIGYDGDYYYVADKGAKIDSLGGLMKSEKTAVNSNRTDTTVLFTFDNGEKKVLRGLYTFQMLYRMFNYNMSNPTLKKVLDFASNLLGCEDVTKKYTFNDMAEAIYHLGKNNCEIQSKIQSFTDSLKGEWKTYGSFDIWMDAIFNYWPNKKVFHTDCSVMNTRSNCNNAVKDNGKAYLSKCYLIHRRGVDHRKINVSGQIIVEVIDETLIDRLRNGSGFCTCLDGGICRVLGLYKYEPVYRYKDKWVKIFEGNNVEYIDLKELV